jgi:EpsI family protein
MGTNRISWVLAALMLLATVGGLAARPTVKASERGQAISLETEVPKSFGDWTVLPDSGPQVVNPQTKEILDRIYSQLLSRTYVNKQGYHIMLSMAYGDDQRGALQAHKPEVCYPAQGFVVRSNQAGQLVTAHGKVEVRRLATALGPRSEPLTYWFTVGDQVMQSKLQKRMAEIRLGMTGQIPDGLLFRISSIDSDTMRGFEMQQRFAADLLDSVPARVRKRLSGLGPAEATVSTAPVAAGG